MPRDHGVTYDPNATILIAPNMRQVFRFSHDLGNFTFPDGYIIAENFEDAWEELADWRHGKVGNCDHGDPDELKAILAKLEGLPEGWSAAKNSIYERASDWVAQNCDCDMTTTGQYVWLVDYHMAEVPISVDDFCRIFPAETGWEEPEE